MKRTVLLAYLLLSSTAPAEWVETVNHHLDTHFVDYSRMQKGEGSVRLWELYNCATDDRTAAGEGYRSIKVLHEYDCLEKKVRVLSVVHYAGKNGTGKILPGDSVVGDWKAILPGSTSDTVWQVTCREMAGD